MVTFSSANFVRTKSFLFACFSLRDLACSDDTVSHRPYTTHQHRPMHMSTNTIPQLIFLQTSEQRRVAFGGQPECSNTNLCITHQHGNNKMSTRLTSMDSPQPFK